MADIPGDALATEGKEALKRERLTEVEVGKWLERGMERVASFLVELSKRYDTCHILVLPMTRSDIADYLGLTIETVCRELSALKRYGIIASTSLRPDRIELRDCKALEALCEVSTQKGAPRWHTREETSA